MSRRYWVCGLRTDWHSCANLSVHLFWYLFLGTHSVEWLWKKCLHLLLSLHFILAHTTSHIPPLFLLLNILVFFFSWRPFVARTPRLTLTYYIHHIMSHFIILAREPNHLRVLHLATSTTSNFILFPLQEMSILHIHLIIFTINFVHTTDS